MIPSCRYGRYTNPDSTNLPDMKAGSLYSMLEVDFVREFRARSRRAAVDVFSILPIWQTWKQHRNAMKINLFMMIGLC